MIVGHPLYKVDFSMGKWRGIRSFICDMVEKGWLIALCLYSPIMGLRRRKYGPNQELLRTEMMKSGTIFQESNYP